MDYESSRTLRFTTPCTANSVSPQFVDNVNDTAVVYKSLKETSLCEKNKIEQVCSNRRWIWNKVSRGLNPYERVPHCVEGKKISRAYFKMWEILSEFRLLDDYTDKTNPIDFLHLCEGPGGFIQACREYRDKIHKDEESIQSDKHLGITLKPKQTDENLPDFDPVASSGIRNCEVTYGEDGTGDLYNTKNIKWLGKQNKFDVITADGGFDVSSDFDNQEQLSIRLFIAQVLSALESQKTGGHFVMKIFDTHSRAMVDLLYILRMNYKMMYMFKPEMSRPCNSEYYVVCVRFNGTPVKSHITKLYTLLNKMKEGVYVSSILKKEPPAGFLTEIAYYISEISKTQFKNINYIINTINQGKARSDCTLSTYYLTQKKKAQEYCVKHRLV